MIQENGLEYFDFPESRTYRREQYGERNEYNKRLQDIDERLFVVGNNPGTVAAESKRKIIACLQPVLLKTSFNSERDTIASDFIIE